jgi:hypothetical protein
MDKQIGRRNPNSAAGHTCKASAAATVVLHPAHGLRAKAFRKTAGSVGSYLWRAGSGQRMRLLIFPSGSGCVRVRGRV